MTKYAYSTPEQLAELRAEHSGKSTLSDATHLVVFDSDQEYNNYLESITPETPEPPSPEIEWSLDEPLKSKVTVKFVGAESAITVPYPTGFQWDDEWLINSALQR